MPVPTRRLAVVAVGLAVLRVLLPDGFPGGILGLDLALVVVVLVDFVLAPRPQAIGVERQLAPTAVLGHSLPIVWRLTNPTGRSVRVAMADDLVPSLHAGTRRVRAVLPPGGSATARTTLAPVRRGHFRPTTVTVRVDGPLGLISRQRDRRLPASLRVLPPFRSKDEAELKINRARLLEIGLRSAQGRGGGTEFEQLREYGPDDDFRRVDWAATARSGKAIVRTYRAERNQTVITLLDAGRLMAARVDDVPRLEHAMDAALMLATVATRLGDRFGLVTFAGEVRTVLDPSKNRAQVGRVTEALYDLEAELVEADYRGAFAATVARFRRRALLVLLTELSEQAAEEFLVPALPLIARSHVVVVGAVRDPEVEAWAAAPVTDSETAHRRAAALAALAERHRLATRLRALGATVVDAPPGRLASELADTYLRLKAVGRL